MALFDTGFNRGAYPPAAPPKRYSTFDVKHDAWQYDAPIKSYYLHIFSKKQPDLNRNNPKLRQEVHQTARYWLDNGIDGFRVDAF